MPKPGKASQLHRTQRAVDKSLPPSPRPWVQANLDSSPSDDEHTALPFYVNEEWEGQVYQRTRINATGRLVDFATAVQLRRAGSDDGWIDIERVDCAHGEVHIDRSLPNGTTAKDSTKIPADCRDNLDRAFKWATDYVWDTGERLRPWL